MRDSALLTAEAVLDNGRYGSRTIRFETGRLARQAGGAVAAYLNNDSMVLSTTTASRQPREQFDFFPLTVDVEERMYAVGRIPGSFFRREGRPGENAILTCRLIDRPLRPSFAKGLRNEVQVVVTVMSLDPNEMYDVLAINAASASTQIAGLPFSGPIGGVRVALVEGQWLAFPNWAELEEAVFDMVVAGRVLPDGDVAIMMVEAEATDGALDRIAEGFPKPDEDVVTAGLTAAKGHIRTLVEAQAALAAQAAKPVGEFPRFLDYPAEVYEAVAGRFTEEVISAVGIMGKADRSQALAAIRDQAVAQFGERFGEAAQIAAAVDSLTKESMRQRVLRDGVRMDGRRPNQVRDLAAEVHVLPRVHGSALFERGETQVLGVTTLNMLDMEQRVDSLSPEDTKRYMHNYNMPPYSTGETGRVGSPKRREIGHGALAERAIVPVLPSRADFPYAIRQVSEAIGSNGSTSMASVCAASLSLLAAGVPLRDMVAGIAMGLISGEVDGETRYVALTDILGAEDALGDMDFKVAGTADYITALQLDTKLDGLPAHVLSQALAQAKEARATILEVMQAAIREPGALSQYAPRILTVRIPVDKIGEVIGPKGKVINQLQADTGARISVEDDGTIYIAGSTAEAAEAARTAINSIANPQQPTIGERYLGTVVKTAAFGAFVSLTPGKDGLLHVSQIRKLAGGKRVENVEDVVSIGQKILVEVDEIDPRGKLSLVPVIEDGQQPIPA
ncbi:MAG: polyribonucleotide nucleotidyltransferase [Actinomycetales bacterium]|nr:polyribonucleotide nucleotidyltransferase [Actinomycetales bacterium]